jgi:tRNA U34 5-carboxymethylaminomethyl modifying GTPase MnmE/TrmE
MATVHEGEAKRRGYSHAGDEESTGNLDELASRMERSLREEVAFWDCYIQYCRDRSSPPVPQVAFEALAHAEAKLKRFMTISKRGRRISTPMH